MEKIVLIFVLMALNIFASDIVKFYNPSFDCKKVKQESIEYEICTNNNLSRHDRELNKIWKSFRLITSDMKQEQRAWINSRNKCKNNSCIKDRYQTRIKDLNISLSNQNSFPKYIIDAIRKVDNNMKIKWRARSYIKDDAKRKRGLVFKKELFTFKDIRYKKPLIRDVKYNNEKIEKVLGDCYKYKFYLHFFWDYKALGYGFVESREALSETPNKYKDYAEFTIWNVNIQGKESFLIKRYDISELNGRKAKPTIFIVDKYRCTKRNGDYYYNLLHDVNSKEIKMASYSTDMIVVIMKDKEYIFNPFITNRRIVFKMSKPLDAIADNLVAKKYKIPFESETKETKKEEK